MSGKVSWQRERFKIQMIKQPIIKRILAIIGPSIEGSMVGIVLFIWGRVGFPQSVTQLLSRLRFLNLVCMVVCPVIAGPRRRPRRRRRLRPPVASRDTRRLCNAVGRPGHRPMWPFPKPWPIQYWSRIRESELRRLRELI